MPKLSISGFNGITPRTSATMLGQNQATIAQDINLYAGELRTWGASVLEFVPANGGPIYSMRKIWNDAGQSVWLTWSGDVDLVWGPLADTTEIRLYYTDGLTPRKTNFAMATGGAPPYPSSWLNMGVPAPLTAPSVGIVAGTFPLADTRAYVYTYISTFGTVSEESAPSAASPLITITPNEGVNIFNFAPAPTANYHITSLRIYRTIAGATTGSNYAYLDELPIDPVTGILVPAGVSVNGQTYSNSTYTDNHLAVELGAALATEGWSTPPLGLTGITAMPNGILAGFVGNTVYFSEPFFPHSWPFKYSQVLNDAIVGLGVFGTSLVACTRRYPYILNGTQPAAMTVEQVPLREPCVAKRSIVSDSTGNSILASYKGQGGVSYASPNGLVSIGPYSRAVSSYALFRRKEWQALIPSTLISVTYDGRYVGFYNNGAPAALIMSSDDTPALALKSQTVTAAWTDPYTGFMYYANTADNMIYRIDANPQAPLIYTWQSKRFVLPHGETWSALKVDGDYSAAGAVLIYLYGDDAVLQATLSVSGYDPVRVPPFRARELIVKVSGTLAVRSVALATSVLELRT